MTSDERGKTVSEKRRTTSGEAHMKEFPDYYERLERMEREAERDWAGKLP